MESGIGSQFRLVALDIDGTILDSAGRVSAALKEVLHRLRESGIRTVLCTGRRWRSALPVFEELEHACSYVVCCGGALIKESRGDRTLYVNPLKGPTTRLCARLYRQCGLVPFFLFDRALDEPEVLVSERDRKRARQVVYLKVNGEATGQFRGLYPPDIEQCLEVYTVDEAARVNACRHEIEAAIGRRGIVKAMFQPRYGPDQLALEVHDPSATKWSALQWLLGQWGLGAEQVVAVGDDVNDVPMLRAAGLSFAMGNASEEVKAAADFVTASNDEHGVAEALRGVFAELVLK